MSETTRMEIRAVLESANRPIDPGGDFEITTLTNAQRWFLSWVTDILVYIVVLNLFNEFVDAIQIGSFWESVLAATLMKALIVVVGEVEHRVRHFFTAGGYNKILMVLALWAVLFFGKLIILTLVDLAFENVSFHSLLEEILLIVTMIVASAVVWLVYDKLGSGIEVVQYGDSGTGEQAH